MKWARDARHKRPIRGSASDWPTLIRVLLTPRIATWMRGANRPKHGADATGGVGPQLMEGRLLRRRARSLISTQWHVDTSG